VRRTDGVTALQPSARISQVSATEGGQTGRATGVLTIVSGVPTLSSLPASHLRTTPLDALHRRLGARMVAFAGWSMPVQYPASEGGGTLAEHQAVRTTAGLFDVSHMGQVRLTGANAAAALERLVPADIQALKPHTQRYTMFTNEAGGILDDIMVANHGDHLELVINAARADADIAHLQSNLDGTGVTLTVHEDRALLALQGPGAVQAMAALAPDAAAMPFMGVAHLTIAGAACWLTRSGYTGEDGYEISVPSDQAERVAEALLAQPSVLPAGLAARDTLRLEAGLCLYGHDIDELTTPVEAGLTWSIGKRRRAALDFPGAAVIADQLANGVTRRRVGLRLEGRALARAHTEIAAEDGTLAGTITSGSFSPSLGSPIAMGYVRRDLAADSTKLGLLIRGQRHPARVVPLPFIPHRFAR
jgi:aminomethyltransferase